MYSGKRYLHKVPLISYSHSGDGPSLIGTTIGNALEAAVERTPDRTAFVFAESGVRFTYKLLLQKVSALIPIS